MQRPWQVFMVCILYPENLNGVWLENILLLENKAVRY